MENIPVAIIYPSTKKNYVRIEYNIKNPQELKLAVKGMPESNYSKELKADIHSFLYKVLFDLRNTPLDDQSPIIASMVQAYME